jgi:hypothetical protein
MNKNAAFASSRQIFKLNAPTYFTCMPRSVIRARSTSLCGNDQLFSLEMLFLVVVQQELTIEPKHIFKIK